mmetsp:Transcript_95788/g.260024  ORF Transcript_95788/g.260024 Transcript_95788/m.260024 type:complete len:109 (-) Transcript_95788:57-383(-)
MCPETSAPAACARAAGFFLNIGGRAGCPDTCAPAACARSLFFNCLLFLLWKRAPVPSGQQAWWVLGRTAHQSIKLPSFWLSLRCDTACHLHRRRLGWSRARRLQWAAC